MLEALTQTSWVLKVCIIEHCTVTFYLINKYKMKVTKAICTFKMVHLVACRSMTFTVLILIAKIKAKSQGDLAPPQEHSVWVYYGSVWVGSIMYDY